MSRAKRWQSWELILILNYINENFDLWYENPREECIKAIRATHIPRSLDSVYSKIYKVIRAMEHYLETGEKTCEIIWKDIKIYDLLARICRKNGERKEKETKEEELIKKRKIDSNDEVDQTTAESSSSQMDVDVSQLPFKIEAIDELYNHKMQEAEREYKNIRKLTGQISQLQFELNKKVEKRNVKVENLKNFRYMSDVDVDSPPLALYL